MVPVLALAACGPRLELALGGVPGGPGVIALAGPTPRSDIVLAAIDLLLQAAGLEAKALSAVVATCGPGSFTGVRVALATAQGLTTGLGIPGCAFGSLPAQAARTDVPTCLAAQPARREAVWTQTFVRADGPPRAAGEPALIATAALAAAEVPVIAPAGLVLPAGTPTAPAHGSTAEALLELFACEDGLLRLPLAPLYLEPPAVVPPARKE
jgi:tRNA threonylcarbamoyl adenosine modification protein YeaZ